MKYQILFLWKNKKNETIYMKCQIVFWGKNKKNISKCLLLKILPRALSVKILVDAIFNYFLCYSLGLGVLCELFLGDDKHEMSESMSLFLGTSKERKRYTFIDSLLHYSSIAKSSNHSSR